jgi:hypothetical protein
VSDDTTKTEGASSRHDPILAAIERHRLADAAFDAAIAGPQLEEDKLGLMDAETRALWGLVEVRPTTLKGIWALCDHLAEYAAREALVSARKDYNHGRNWSFLSRLLEKIRDAVDGIRNRATDS